MDENTKTTLAFRFLFEPSDIKNKNFKKYTEGVQEKFQSFNDKKLSEFVWFSDDLVDEEVETQKTNPMAPIFANPFGITTTKPKIFSSETFFSWLMKSKLPSNKIKIRLK